ncbi:tyrosine-type recombinase/integrase [Sphingomonas oryzagri]|uniref:Tyrosine-type recombinase/integrase n=1 Tax=Sphingomonas oryzagri TaxID=3042314 RepID=A0ABT6N2H4_9SPHN|nr:tyrosine-type recombinase/integrase [Sphingomonas oryzagri]MDH7639488.1 tyrosine-type recombinase/integrase [Sphingomonas oryzagri]
MAKHSAANTRIKREYFQYLREARRCGIASVDAAAKAISRFEDAIGHRDFKRFHREQAVAFKRKLGEQRNDRTGKPLSKSTIDGTLRALREFFVWLAGQPGYKSQLHYADADYFNLSEKETAIARAKRPKAVPTPAQVHHVLASLPNGSAIEKRNRALIAFALLTGARDGALASFRLKHVDLVQGRVTQDGREVRTKFAKTFTTWFFPVGGDALAIVADWIGYLECDQFWSADDPLFPATEIGLGDEGGFVAAGLSRRGWSTAAPIRTIFREAFAAAGLPYFNPHSFRDMLAQFGERACRTPEEFKAWSQNLGHAHVLTTLTSYGTVPDHRQAELIRGLGEAGDMTDPLDDPKVRAVLARLLERQPA